MGTCCDGGVEGLAVDVFDFDSEDVGDGGEFFDLGFVTEGAFDGGGGDLACGGIFASCMCVCVCVCVRESV